MEATNTTPKPRDSGPLIYRYLSLGAQAAVMVSAPTTPAVYTAARTAIGPEQNLEQYDMEWRHTCH